LCDTYQNAGNVEVSFDWKNDQFSGLEPLHQDHIVHVLISQLLEEYAIPDANTEGGLILEIPFLQSMNKMGLYIVDIQITEDWVRIMTGQRYAGKMVMMPFPESPNKKIILAAFMVLSSIQMAITTQ
jgi:hypothetical protein